MRFSSESHQTVSKKSLQKPNDTSEWKKLDLERTNSDELKDKKNGEKTRGHESQPTSLGRSAQICTLGITVTDRGSAREV